MYIVSPPLQRNSTKNSVCIPLIDQATRLPMTGKVAANITATIVGEHDGTGNMRLVDLANVKANWNDGGWAEVHATQFPGLYRLDLPNKKFVDDAQSSNLYLCVQCAGAEIVYMQIPLGQNAVSGVEDRRK